MSGSNLNPLDLSDVEDMLVDVKSRLSEHLFAILHQQLRELVVWVDADKNYNTDKYLGQIENARRISLIIIQIEQALAEINDNRSAEVVG